MRVSEWVMVSEGECVGDSAKEWLSRIIRHEEVVPHVSPDFEA